MPESYKEDCSQVEGARRVRYLNWNIQDIRDLYMGWKDEG